MNALEHPWVVAIAVLYALSLIVSVPALIRRARRGILFALCLFALAFAVNTTVIVARWAEAGRPPFKTLFETMIFYPWCTGLVTLALIALRRLMVLIPFASGVSILGLGYALIRPDVELVMMPPALQRAWFVPHVVTYFMSYAALFASFALATVALYAERREGRLALAGGGTAGGVWPGHGAGWRGTAAGWQAHAHGAAIFGVITLTAGLVMGAVWGKYAWGDYWGWDPKESWALVTWLAYVIYLHLRLMDGWHGRRAMLVLVCSFAAVVFTYLGMSMLPTADGSLHVYQ
ncbi:MAG: cytochrome c biogenesis protein CcsA [Planctomycetota bacterium]|jgi:cytochrome c-type biogenesis protein CcsB